MLLARDGVLVCLSPGTWDGLTTVVLPLLVVVLFCFGRNLVHDSV